MGCTKCWGKELPNVTARPFSILFATQQLEAVSDNLKKANVMPLLKKKQPQNYTPVRLTSFLGRATNPGKPFLSLWRTKSFLRKISSGKGEGNRNICGDGVCLPKQVLNALRACLPGAAGHVPAEGKKWMNSLLCFACTHSFCFPFYTN